MHLSKRLQAIAGFITPGNRLADIGTDHGYVPIYLVLNHIIPSAIAMDINKGPLDKAREHISLHQLEKKIEIRLSDGLEKLLPGEADTVLIAGMGGALMSRIIKDGEEVLKSVPELILQPQSEISDFRHFLHDHSYKIIREHMLIEDGKFYVMMHAIHGNESYERETEYIYGKLLLKEQNPILLSLINKQLTLNENIYAHLSTLDTENAHRQSVLLQKMIDYGKEALKYYEMQTVC